MAAVPSSAAQKVHAIYELRGMIAEFCGEEERPNLAATSSGFLEAIAPWSFSKLGQDQDKTRTAAYYVDWMTGVPETRRSIYSRVVRLTDLALFPRTNRKDIAPIKEVIDMLIADLESVESTFPNSTKIRFSCFHGNSGFVQVHAGIPDRQLDIALNLSAEMMQERSWTDLLIKDHDLRGWNVSLHICCHLVEDDTVLQAASGWRANSVRECGILQMLKGSQTLTIGGISRRVTRLEYSMPDEGAHDPALLLDIFTTCANTLQYVETVVIQSFDSPASWAVPLIRSISSGVKHLTFSPISHDALFEANHVSEITQAAYLSTLTSLDISWSLGPERSPALLRLHDLWERSTFTLTARCIAPEEFQSSPWRTPLSKIVSWAKSWAGGLSRHHLVIELPLGIWEKELYEWSEKMPDVLADLDGAGFDWRASK